MDHLTSPTRSPEPPRSTVRFERVQTGVRVEKRMLKTLKALAEYLDVTLGDLLESIVLHAFEGDAPFDRDTLDRIEQLREVYGLDLDASQCRLSRQFSPEVIRHSA
ncbi:MAG: hypothetical protein AAGD38_04975 [Acidobacteriota bacterium]